MIIIDEAAEERLERTLNRLEAAPGLTRCIHLDFAAIKACQPDLEPKPLQQQVVALTRRHCGAQEIQMYACADGDIFLLAPELPGTMARSFIAAVAKQYAAGAGDSIARIYQLAQSMKTLRYHLETKLETIATAKAAQINQQESEQKNRTRRAILNPQLTPQDAAAIGQRRRQRNAPELMLIEDDAFSSRLVSNVLQRHYHLTVLDDAYMALRTYARLAPDILFLDIGLPNVTGHELLERIMAIDPEACVVMLSGSADRSNVLRAMEKGAKGFIAKPFTREKIMQYIERCPSIKRHGENHENP